MKKPANKESILFVCTHNSARSQMAEGLVNAFFKDRFEAYSGGTKPSAVNPRAVKALAELDIDISKNKAKNLKQFQGKKFDYIVTLCWSAKEECPYFPGAKEYIHEGFENPSEFRGTENEIMAGFRRVRDELREWLRIFASEHR